MNYVLTFFATVLMAFEFAASKKYQAMEGAGIGASLRFNAITGALTTLVMWAIAGFKLEWSVFSLVMALGVSLCALGYSLLGFKVMKLGGMALYSTFLMIGGMLLPYIFGVVFLDEVLTLPRLIGVIVILVAVVLSNFSREKVSIKLLLLCCAVFILNGFVSIFSKCHQISTYPTVSTVSFVLYGGVFKLLLSGSLLLLFGKKLGAFKPNSRFSVLFIAASTLMGTASYLLQLTGARSLPASVLYPIVTGGGIIFSAVSGRVFFREKLSRLQIISVVLCFIGTLLFL